VSAADLQSLMSKTAENLIEKKYTRANTNMMKHAIIVSGKITLGQTSYYILKNSQSAEFALLPENEVCSLSRAQTLVTSSEAQSLKQTLRKVILNAEIKKKSNRKPTSNK
jgi:hypothetical protein